MVASGDCFVKASGATEIELPVVKKGPDAKMPVQLALCYLELVVFVKDLGAAAALLHGNLWDQEGEGCKRAPVKAVLFGDFLFAQDFFQRTLARMDELLGSDEVEALERSGWAGRSDLGVSHVR